MSVVPFKNPFRPGAGHMPPYLAGRGHETEEFIRLLDQDVILQNLVLTGLRGVGKTVLLDTFKPLAMSSNWLWVGTDLSESSSLSEERIAIRLMADLAVVTSAIIINREEIAGFGFHPPKEVVEQRLDSELMADLYKKTPGLTSDKIKAVLELVSSCLKGAGRRGIIFAYDEAQNLSDHAMKDEFPLSLMLDVFQSIQKKNIPFMLVLTGLPTLFPKLVEARTFAERMFRVVTLDRLNDSDSRDALLKPTAPPECPVKMAPAMISAIIADSGGYPYFLQFMGREVYDVVIQKFSDDPGERIHVPRDEINRKLDTDFFAGRWARATDRQRELLRVIAHLENCDDEFTVQEIAEQSRQILPSPFSPSHINQMLVKLGDAGLVYKNRHGKYSFAVPLLGRFILRQS